MYIYSCCSLPYQTPTTQLIVQSQAIQSSDYQKWLSLAI